MTVGGGIRVIWPCFLEGTYPFTYIWNRETKRPVKGGGRGAGWGGGLSGYSDTFSSPVRQAVLPEGRVWRKPLIFSGGETAQPRAHTLERGRTLSSLLEEAGSAPLSLLLSEGQETPEALCSIWIQTDLSRRPSLFGHDNPSVQEVKSSA